MELEGVNADIPALVENMKSSIVLKDRKFLGKSFEKSFTGKEAVEWLVKNVPNITQDQAIQLGKRLISKGFVKHATSRKGFSNSYQIFQFSTAPTRGTCGFSETCINDLMPDELFEVYQITAREGMYKAKKGLRGFITNRATSTGSEVLDWLMERFNITRPRAREIALQLLQNKYMVSICGTVEFNENSVTWYAAGYLEYLNAIDTAEETQSPTLSLTGGHIAWVPTRLADLPSLKTLDLSDNEITGVCENISFLPALEDLIIANNRIICVTPDISKLRSLKKLDLRHNSISTLPPTISQLPFLETLILDHNKLTGLPSEFSALTTLRVLSLASNNLKALPDCTSKYEKLEVLNLQDNVEISTVPAFVAGLTSLQEIRLERNELEQLPAFLGGLPKIRYIGLNGNNKIHCPPKSLIEMGSGAIIAYLKSLQESTVPCFCGKMLILGMENMGKTSLLQAIQKQKKSFLRSPKSPKSHAPISTDGINISTVTFDEYLKEPPADGSPVITEKKLFRKRMVERLILGIWDFAGQDTYYTTHEFFLTDNAIYTVVWNMRMPLEECRVDFWLKSIQARAPNAPVILVATHVDLVDKHRVSTVIEDVKTRYTQRYPQIAMIECVSAATMDGIKDFKKDLRRLAMQQPFIRNRIPGKHYGLAQAIVDQRKIRSPPIVTWDEYKEIAKLVYITDQNTLEMATRHLHELGFLMHFRDEGLKNIVILSPQWLSDIFSSIITVGNTFCKNGRLALKNLPHMWKSDDFPAHLQGKLLRILEIFEIIFITRKPNTPENELEAIVPSLLPSEQPKSLQPLWDACLELREGEEKETTQAEEDGASKKDELHTFGRRFEFSFITRAFFSRLLVRLLHVGQPAEYWRYGILSELKGAYGLVKFDSENCVLTVEVKSRHFKEGADLFSLILDNTNTLISDWPKVKSVVTVPCVCSEACHKEPHQYQLTDIENCLLARVAYILCPKTDALAPDLSLANLKANMIDPEEITGLDPIGTGSFADVFKAAFRGEVVAVKQLTLSDGDTGSVRYSDLASSSSMSSDSFGSMNNSLNGADDSFNGSKSFASQHSVSLSSLKGSAQVVSQSMLEYLHEFRREVVLMSTLQHENIVCMKGFCYEPYSIIMEYMDQGSLSSYVKHNKATLSWQVSVSLALDVARGMQFLHNTSPPIVHRDLKGPNVLLKAIEQPPFIQAKISDFGLSRTLVSGFVTVSKVVDNPRWCAPEIIKKTPYDEKSDVYSFAIILWEIITGEQPFAEFDIKWTHVLEDKIIHEGLRPTIPSTCDPTYATLMKRCWNDSPHTRPSFSQVVQDLEAIMLRAL